MKIMIAAHDAGGAEILSSLCWKYKNRFNWTVLAAGPAEKSFRSKDIAFTSLKKWEVPEAQKQLRKISPDLLLTGTGWGTDLERNFMEAARRETITRAAYLDGWFNFRERFGTLKNWKTNLPDYVLVGDEDAYKLGIRNGFPKKVLARLENPFWDSLESNQETAAIQNGTAHLLYVMQPGQKTYQKWMTRLKNRKNDIFLYPNLFFKSLGESRSRVTVRLRPHPSELTDKISNYIETLKKQGYRVEKSIQGSSILEDLKWSDGVVGLESMALIMALALGKKAISYLPEKKLECRLPQTGISKIRDGESLKRVIFTPAKKNKFSFLKKQKAFNRSYSFPKQVKGLVHV